MNILTKKVCTKDLYEIAIDEDTGNHLFGVLVDYGPTSFVNYYKISMFEYYKGLVNIRLLKNKIEIGGCLEELYYSPHQAFNKTYLIVEQARAASIEVNAKLWNQA